MSSTYTLHEVTTRAESDSIVDLAWVAWREPYISSFQLFHPVHGPTSQDYEAAVLADKERAWNTHLAYQGGLHPKYRGKGIGTLLMDWGTNMADKLGLEGFIEASDNGRSLYQKHGFRTLMKLSIDLEKKNASGEWNRLLHELGSFHFYINYRPVGGVFEEGKPQTPWQVDQTLAKESRSEVKFPVMTLGS
ncbi:uncharacterized protein EAE97_006896 [Botrytis byssoidea]|uniref:N-acetyltransferase domain-containing protein n=1 Tax=Botrytis byssoidea TaxID=139641 RepID=A0A9P5IH45_9HELO|nr:uncharacterized protein EAE97_006896 [Botrytis byssoidea]KAF7940710.1 hypothetical protein EAE97_006896 [Botrytis byssoidea]